MPGDAEEWKDGGGFTEIRHDEHGGKTIDGVSIPPSSGGSNNIITVIKKHWGTLTISVLAIVISTLLTWCSIDNNNKASDRIHEDLSHIADILVK